MLIFSTFGMAKPPQLVGIFPTIGDSGRKSELEADHGLVALTVEAGGASGLLQVKEYCNGFHRSDVLRGINGQVEAELGQAAVSFKR
jgi:hypothetical protein